MNTDLALPHFAKSFAQKGQIEIIGQNIQTSMMKSIIYLTIVNGTESTILRKTIYKTINEAGKITKMRSILIKHNAEHNYA